MVSFCDTHMTHSHDRGARKSGLNINTQQSTGRRAPQRATIYALGCALRGPRHTRHATLVTPLNHSTPLCLSLSPYPYRMSPSAQDTNGSPRPVGARMPRATCRHMHLLERIERLLHRVDEVIGVLEAA